MRPLIAAALLLMFSPVTPANAQDYKTILDIPPGTTLISLSATEQVEIEQDILVANLQYQATNSNPKTLQDEINKVMQKAVEEARKVKDIEVSTQQYYVYETQPRLMQGTQGMMLRGKNSGAILELTGKLQEMGLTMGGLGYEVSPEALEKTRDGLLENALLKLKAKAERTAKALGKAEAELLQINVDMGGYYPQPMMMGRAEMAVMSADAKMAAPVADPGKSQVSLTVSAQALLK